MAGLFSFIKRLYKTSYPPIAPKSPNALKLGILGAAKIAPSAVITPALSHSEIVIYAVAARDLDRARKFATKYGIEKAYGSYQELLDDKDIDIIYNPLPNGLHYEWTRKALEAGKHVLNEKPSACTAAETRALFELAEQKNLVLLDAYHHRFHPATLRVKEIVTSGELGKVKHIDVSMLLTKGMFGHDDIRFDYDLGGGAMMDLGCYQVDCIEYMSSSKVKSVIAATAERHVPPNAPASFKPNIDRGTLATVELSGDATATLTNDLMAPPTWGIIPKWPEIKLKINCEEGSVEMLNYVLPSLFHWIEVKKKDGTTRVEKVYKGEGGEEWWSTYRWQLGAMVDRVHGQEPKSWVGKEESISVMECIEKIYEKTGLGSRPSSLSNNSG